MSEDAKKHWIGFDLGGTKMLAVVLGDDFKPLGKSRKRTKGNEGAKAGLERIAKTIRGALEEAKVTAEQLGGIGIGCPGTVDLDEGIIFDAPNLGWQDVRLRKYLEDEFKCPAVIMNDVDSGLYGEYRFGSAKNARCAFGVFPGTGIGGGCIYNGAVFRGKKSSCMEIGHFCVDADGPLCGCGRLGCLEAVASRLAISGDAAQAAYRGEAPHLLALAGTNLAEIRSGVLAESINQGDKSVERIVRRACGYMGVAIGTIVNLLAPDVIVLGGGLVEAMPKFFLKEVKEATIQHTMPSLTKSFEMVVAELGDDAGVLGAAAWVKKQVT